MISDVTNGTSQQKHNPYQYPQFQELIIVQAGTVIIWQIYFVDLLNPQALLNIQYNLLRINRLQLKKIYFQTKQQLQVNIIQQLIQIHSIQNETSTCFIQNFTAAQIFIEIYSNYFLDQSNNLIILSIFGGQVNIVQLIIDNIQSNHQFYIIKANQIQMRIYNINLDNIQNVGLLYFFSSKVYCVKVFYETTYLYQIRVPLLKNDELLSRDNTITLKDLKLHNLSTPLIDIKSNSSLEILIVNLIIQKFILSDDFIRIEQFTSELSIVKFNQLYVSDQLYWNQQFYFLNGNNLDVQIELFQIKNSYMGIYHSTNNRKFNAKNFQILNATITQTLFLFNNYYGDVTFQQIIIKNLTARQWNYQSQFCQQFNEFQAQYYVRWFFNQLIQRAKIIKNNPLLLQIILLSNNLILGTQIKLTWIYKDYKFTKLIAACSSSRKLIFQLKKVEIRGTQEIQFISSDLYQTNILNRKIDANISYPIQLSFHENYLFSVLKVNKSYHVQYSQDSKIIYVPSGQQFMNFSYFDLRQLAHKSIYNTFSIMISSRTLTLTQNQIIVCSLIQSIDGTFIGKYSNYQEFPLKAGLNTFDDFIFIMNPYQNYSFLQNDILCPNYTLRFDVRILPCQLGEYLYYNKCITCDINKNLYSIIKKAQYCQNFNPEFISEIKVGRVKLQQNYWRPSLTSNLIVKCETDSVCLGGWTNGDLSCKPSRVGALCKECDIYNTKGEGQFVQSGQQCLECQPNFLLLLKGFSIFIWIIFITLMNYNTNQKITEKFLQFKIINRVYSNILMRQSIDQFSIIIKIYINYIFIIYLVQENLQFLDNKILLGLNFISNPSTIVTTELDCILVNLFKLDIQYIQLASSLISPIIILMIIFFIYVILLALRLQRYRFNLIIIITYSVYLFNQQIIIQNQIKLLSYKLISGIKWIYSNQQFKFYTSKHFQMIIAFIAPTTSLILLIPILLFFLLRFKDRGSIWCIKKYGIIYCDFKQNAYFWEIIRIYTKHVIILLLYFFNQIDQSILILFLSVKICLLEKLLPYPLNNINKLENYAYRLTAFQLIIIFQLIKQLPILSYTILAILNIDFGYRIVLLLIRCFTKQYRNVIQKVIKWVRQEFPNRFIRLEQQNIQIIIIMQKFRRAVHKKIQNKSSIHYISQQMPMERENLITLHNAEIELQPLQNIRNDSIQSIYHQINIINLFLIS
ncbi:hypothetical protein pb186bvf_008156 [Paramecium bursaria]